MAITKTSKHIENSPESEHAFVFSFDEEGINRKSPNSSSIVKWELIKGYIENKENLYLFYDNKELHDIISKGILGEEKYKKFKIILSQNAKNYA